MVNTVFLDVRFFFTFIIYKGDILILNFLNHIKKKLKNHKEYFLKLNFLKKSQNRHMDFCPFLDLNGFDQLEASGKGSFGKVMKIRNKKKSMQLKFYIIR